MNSYALVLASFALYGCPPYSRGAYATQAYVTTYQQPTYFQADPNVYAAAVADYVKKQAQVQVQADLLTKIDQLTQTVSSLQTQMAQPQVQQPAYQPTYATPQQPVYQSPPAPSKSLDVPPPSPSLQVPGKSSALSTPSPSLPDDSVPPPPRPAANTPPPQQQRWGADQFLPNAGGQRGTTHQLVEALIRNRCSQCHSGNGSSGGMKMFESNGSLATLSYDEIMRIGVTIRDGRTPTSGTPMPPKGPSVSPSDRELIIRAIKQQIVDSAETLVNR